LFGIGDDLAGFFISIAGLQDTDGGEVNQEGGFAEGETLGPDMRLDLTDIGACFFGILLGQGDARQAGQVVEGVFLLAKLTADV